MLEIDQVVNVLKDGEWHDFNEIIAKCRLSKVTVEVILSFLAEYGFVEINGGGRKAKANLSLQRFLRELKAWSREN